ncbi:MAG: glycosyltransferase family 39 protein [Deltaproteobacteria bacterium]|nr:glycosyltransferase family 39 protein [Deltaproteobacteria bacterium]
MTPRERRDRWQRWAGRASAGWHATALCLLALGVAAASASAWHLQPVAAGVLFGVPFFCLVLLLLRRLRLGWRTILIILGGLCIYLVYFGYTQYPERNHDGPSQLEYIRFVAQKLALPPAAQCFVCHHPPLYYALGALAYRFFLGSRLVEPTRGLQLLSLGLHLVLVVFAVLIFRRLTRRRAVVDLATAIVVFWPYSIINSVRVHNDILVGTLLVAGLWALVRWQQDRRGRDLWLACAFAALAALTKSNGYVLAATIVILLLARLAAGPDRLGLVKKALPPLAALGLVLGLQLGLRQASAEEGVVPRVLGTASKVSAREFVGNEPYNYLYFDLDSFLKEPFILSRREGSGRQYFWNHLLKSSLFATHNEAADPETSYRLNARIAGVMAFLQLAMLAYLGAGLFALKKSRLRRYGLPALFASLLLVSILAFRILIPAPHHTDFRFVYPLVVPLSLAYALAVDRFRRRKLVLHYVGYALALPFLLLSVAYFLPKYELWMRWLSPQVVARPLASRERLVPAHTAWDAKGNLTIEDEQIVRLAVSPARDVTRLDVSLDANDRYLVSLYGAGGARRVELGPGAGPGLARYRRVLSPPVASVTAVTVRPVAGDRRYALGHLRLEDE